MKKTNREFQIDQWLILGFSIIGAFALAMASPSIISEFGSKLPQQTLAWKDLILKIAITIGCLLYKVDSWNRFLLKWFPIIVIIDLLSGLVLAIWSMIKYDVMVFYVMNITKDVFYALTIERIVVSIRARRFPSEEREIYDNNKALFAAPAAVMGSYIATEIYIPIQSAVLLYCLGCIGCIGWLIVYHRNKFK